MKRLLAIVFVLYYLGMSVGVYISAHYCGDDLHSVAFASEAEACCEAEDAGHYCFSHESVSCTLHEDEHEACCDNLGILVKADIEDQITSACFKLFIKDIDIDFSIWDESCCELETSLSYTAKDHPPPGEPPKWLSYCSLVLYG